MFGVLPDLARNIEEALRPGVDFNKFTFGIGGKGGFIIEFF
jgi:hypothetical protein